MSKLSLIVGLFVIFIFAISLRVYHFHDLLRFNADQSRDAGIVSAVVSGGTKWPLLGPQAGGTEFRLGPIFYYFQIISAVIFSDTPDVLAYPDLLASIGFLCVLFFFLKNYFSNEVTMLLTGLAAVSTFLVKYSHFAWNPNSTPFWTTLFLLALHRTATVVSKRAEYSWSGVAGVAIGVGIQLHTLLLIIFPIVTILVFLWTGWCRKRSGAKAFILVVIVALLFNIPQIASEYQTGGKNAQAFFDSIHSKGGRGNNIFMNTAKDSFCLAQGSVYLLSGYNISDTCEFKSTRTALNFFVTTFGFLFCFGGGWLVWRAMRRERNLEKKYFLIIAVIYAGSVFLLLIPLANEISMRFYLILPAIILVWAGLWIEYVFEQLSSRRAQLVSVGVIGALLMSNFFFSVQSLRQADDFTTNIPERKVDFEYITLKEVEKAVGFIIANADGQTAILNGNATILFKGGKSIAYLANRSGITIKLKNKQVNSETSVFYLDTTKQKTPTLAGGNPIEKSQNLGRLTIFKTRIP